MQHLREVQGFRSAVLDLANILFPFRDSSFFTAPTKGSHGGARRNAGRKQAKSNAEIARMKKRERKAANQRAYEERKQEAQG